MEKRKNRLSKRVFLVTAGLFMIFFLKIIMEIALYPYEVKKVWPAIHSEFDSELGWAPKKNFKSSKAAEYNISFNSNGFRSPEIDSSKKQVIIFGDSVAMGHDLDDNQTISYFLQEKLEPYGFQAQNLGVAGYGIDQSYLRLKKNIDKFKNLRAAVLIICTANDYYNDDCNMSSGKKNRSSSWKIAVLFRIKVK